MAFSVAGIRVLSRRRAPSIFVRLSLIVLSIFLAYFSWLYVEQPVRQGRDIFANSRAVFGAAAATLALFGGFGLTLGFEQGLPSHVAELRWRSPAASATLTPIAKRACKQQMKRGSNIRSCANSAWPIVRRNMHCGAI